MGHIMSKISNMMLRAGLTALALGAAGSASAVTFASTGGPFAIPDNSIPNSVNSVISVNRSIIVSDVDVIIHGLQHSFFSDLDIYLIHGGRSIELTTDNQGSRRANGTYIFDDSASSSIVSGTLISAGGTFRPEQPLSSFNGLNALGSWTLRIGDDASGDTGTFAGWSLQINGPNNGVPEPASWALMLGGFALTGGALRGARRRGFVEPVLA
jgi:subtilisin-like proprotein convertase family protein